MKSKSPDEALTASIQNRYRPLVEVGRSGSLSWMLLAIIGCAFLLRFTISPQMLNMIMPYSTEGGSFPQKLHVGTYAIVLALLLVMISRPILLVGQEVRQFKAIFRYSAFIILLVIYLMLSGRAGSAGFIIDSYLVACCAGATMLFIERPTRYVLGCIVLGMIIVSALIGTIEAISHHRFLPYNLRELEFRPTGLSGHPLALGAVCAMAIGFVASTRWQIWIKALSITLLFVGVAASGARAALLLAVCEIFFLLVFLPWPGLSPRHQREAKFYVFLLTLVAGAVLIGALYAAGFLSRFGNTLFDQNFDARVKIYDVFSYVSWNEILFGMGPNDLLKIVNEKLNLPYIESAPVTISLLFGIPIALVFAAAFFWLLYRLLCGASLAAWIGTATFLVTALSNNALSSKAPDITILVVLLLAFRTESNDLQHIARQVPHPQHR